MTHPPSVLIIIANPQGLRTDCIVNFTNFTTLRLVYNPKTWYTILILILQRMKLKHREVR